MATTGYRTPFMGSVSVTTTASSVFTLLSAVRTALPGKASFIQIQLDASASGASLYIGDSDVSSTNNGVALTAALANQQFAWDSNLLVLNQIYLLASTGTVQVNIIVVVR